MNGSDVRFSERTSVVKQLQAVSSWGLAALALCLTAGLAEPARAEGVQETTHGIGKPAAEAGALRVAPDSRGTVVSGVPGRLTADLPPGGAGKSGRTTLDQPGCTICLGTPASVTWTGPSGSFHVANLANNRSLGFSGALEMKAVVSSAQPVFGQTINSIDFSATESFSALQAGYQYTPVDSGTVAFYGSSIPAGQYWLLLLAREYVTGTWYYTDFVLMDKKVSCTGSACSVINPPSSCVEDANTMCLVGGRYRATGRWKNQYAGGAQANLSKAKLTDVTGAFWIADASTYEFVVRINTATNNGRAWISILTFTDVEFWVAVTDVTNGQTKEYHSDPGNRTLLYDPSFFVYP